jgi:two-component system response regulator FlrC
VCVDVRVVATTNRSIKDQIAAGGFREDLYYRLNVIPIHLPPLRDRVDDIPLLADFFIRKYNFLDNRSVKGLTDEALSMLSNMAWRGNVRELENTIERAVLLCKTDYLDAAGFSVTGAPPHPGVASAPAPRFFPLREMEKNAIFHALDQTNGNRTHAAEILGISVRTLRNKLNEYRGRMEMQ